MGKVVHPQSLSKNESRAYGAQRPTQQSPMDMILALILTQTQCRDLVFSRRLESPHVHLNKPMPGKKSKKPFKFFTTRSLAIPANIAVGPLGFRAVLDVDPEGERNYPYHELG